MNKEITTKVDYSLAGFDGPVGIAANIDSSDINVKSIQIAQSNHRCFKVPGIKVSPGSFINGDNFEMFAEGYGSEKHPANGIDLLFVHLEKIWKVYESVEETVKGKVKRSRGEFIEKLPFSMANAGLQSFPAYRNKWCSITYRYIVKMVGDDMPMYFDLKGKGINCAKELNSFFDEMQRKFQRPSFSYIINLKVRSEPTGHDNNTTFTPYLNAYTDAGEGEFLKATAMYAGAKEYSAKADAKDTHEVNANVPEDMQNTTNTMNKVFEGALTLEDDDIDY